MKFLADNQLPVTLARYLRGLGFECQHVLDVKLAEAGDAEICRYAESQDCIVVSKDEDFIYHAKRRNAKVRVIWYGLATAAPPNYSLRSSGHGERSSPAWRPGTESSNSGK